jgi:hypothetical protein
MEDFPMSDDTRMKQELAMMAQACLQDDVTSEEIFFFTDVCAAAASMYNRNKLAFGSLTLRNFTRLINSTYLLREKFSELDFYSAFCAALKVAVVSQIKEVPGQVGVKASISQALLSHFDRHSIKSPDFIGDTASAEHILTESRKKHAEAVMSCIECSIPVLLEGPSAVGKTSLISFLSKLQGTKLERVNNTDTTTYQDYLGTYLPDGMKVQ